MQLRLRGVIGDDGYLLDFRIVKDAMRALCKALDERFLVPTLCPFLEVR